MADSIDEKNLWEIWDEESLLEYEGKWIAFKGKKIISSGEINDLLASFREDINSQSGPIFAFVSFEPRS